MQNEKNINMGSSILDFYMDGYDEGKCDDMPEMTRNHTKSKPKSNKIKASTRRKKSYYKSKKRIEVLASVAGYTPSPECANAVQGILRNHQLPMSEVYCETTFGSSIGNKRRADVANQKLRESAMTEEEMV